MNNEEMRRQVEEDLRLSGRTRWTIDKDGEWQRVPPPSTRAKRLVRHMTNPPRLAVGAPVSWAVAWFSYGHHITDSGFATAYGCWLLAMFIIFWLYELHTWAGGKPRLDE
jgi:hypothetical protein